MKCLVWSVAVSLAALSCAAFDVSLVDAEGRPFDTTGKVEFRTERVSGENGVESIRCVAKGLDGDAHLLNIVASVSVPGAGTVWDGGDEVPKRKANFRHPLLEREKFLMGAAWGSDAGVALATGAEDLNSFEDLISKTDDGGVTLSIAVRAAILGKGGEYSCTFHRIAFSPKYGIRDALARYYPLYPRRFRRDPRVQPGTMGICAEYASWNRGDSESCRFNNATWEWCHGAGRSWGDPLNQEVPTGENATDYRWDDLRYCDRDGKEHRHQNKDLSLEEFDAIQASRLANGYFCGVANGFYMMAVANLGRKIAKRYTDSVAVGQTVAKNDYQFSTEVYTFPECSWGQEIRRQLALLVKKHDIGATAFDVSSPASVYRGGRLAEMKNVGWDRYGPGVVRGVASAKLFDYIRTLPNKRLSGNCAVVVNTKYEHVSDILYLDTMMMETEPWSRRPPYPLALRFALGEKGLTLWEGYSPRDFDPNFNKWAKEDKEQLFRDLGRYAEHRSFATGASLPGNYLTEYVGLMSHAFVRVNAAGFKPVIGATAEGDRWELARYGLGDGSWIAVCNEVAEERKAVLTVYPDEIATGLVGGGKKSCGYVYVPFYGGPAANIFGGRTQKVTCRIGSMLTGVLECAGTADGKGGLAAEWSGDFDALALRLVSRDFKGTVAVRDSFDGYVREGTGSIRLAPGESVTVRYPNTVIRDSLAKIRALKLDDLSAVTVEHADDEDSREMANRISFFFKAVTMPADYRKAKKHVSPVKVAANSSLKARSVRLGDIVVASDDRLEFSRAVRRFLNALNHERYPDYAPDCRMDPAERKYFTFLRY